MKKLLNSVDIITYPLPGEPRCTHVEFSRVVRQHVRMYAPGAASLGRLEYALRHCKLSLGLFEDGICVSYIRKVRFK